VSQLPLSSHQLLETTLPLNITSQKILQHYLSKKRCTAGCAEDPNGLAPTELLRLVLEGLPIGSFNQTLLSATGKLYLCDPALNASAAEAEEALRARNTMHNRVISDAFIPAGGRPNTIHINNWKQFLRPDTGKPSSKLIVEGANLFLTPAARAALHAETGIPIVKDSSANKCGVICSSFEIMSSMLLSDQEFKQVKTVRKTQTSSTLVV
jgi:glutamate dehydrogenase